jgi:hypothetical protein
MACNVFRVNLADTSGADERESNHGRVLEMARPARAAAVKKNYRWRARPSISKA